VADTSCTRVTCEGAPWQCAGVAPPAHDLRHDHHHHQQPCTHQNTRANQCNARRATTPA
jgi:hypothetical protein